MPRKLFVLAPALADQLAGLGVRLREIRKSQGLSMQEVCDRAQITRPTLHRIERGEPAVTIGNYAQVLAVLGAVSDLGNVGGARPPLSTIPAATRKRRPSEAIPRPMHSVMAPGLVALTA